MSTGLLRAIYFDFDGTLVDTFPLAMEIMAEHARQHGLPEVPDAVQLRQWTTRQFLKSRGIGRLRLARFVRFFQAEMRKRGADIQLFAGWKDVLPVLSQKGIRLGVLSSNQGEHIEEQLAKAGVLTYFADIRSYPKLFGKARILRKVLRELRIPREQFLYVGDETRDMEAAGKAGCRSAAVTWGYQAESVLKPSEPQFWLRQPQDLLEIVHSLSQ